MPGASVAADRDIKSLRRALMHWITAWLGALKGAVVVARDQAGLVAARTGRESLNALGAGRGRRAELFDTVGGST